MKFHLDITQQSKIIMQIIFILIQRRTKQMVIKHIVRYPLIYFCFHTFISPFYMMFFHFTSSLYKFFVVGIIMETINELIYTPKGERDYGTLACWGRNSIGKQLEPCLFQVVPAGLLKFNFSCNFVCLLSYCSIRGKNKSNNCSYYNGWYEKKSFINIKEFLLICV